MGQWSAGGVWSSSHIHMFRELKGLVEVIREQWEAASGELRLGIIGAKAA